MRTSSERCKDWYYKNREASIAKARRWQKANPDKASAHAHKAALKLKYKITPEEYQRLVNNQKNLCAICGFPETRKKRLSVDHNHKTGKVRSLLCYNCNSALGLLKENLELLQKAMSYLQQHEADCTNN